MERAAIEARLKQIFQDLFNEDPSAINADSSPDNIKGWDSLQHINLVAGIEEAFGIALDDEEVVQMLSFGLIVEIVAGSLNASAK